ncbi:hypothetical protein V8D89_000671 [Ganoderma adspersum]
MRYSTAILAALMGLLQVSASPVNVVRGDTDSSTPSKPTPTYPGGPESTFAPFPSVSGGFPSGPAFPSESFSAPFGVPSDGSLPFPSGFPSGISLPPFPSGSGFPGAIPSGHFGGVPGTFPSEPSGFSIPYPSDKSVPYHSDKSIPFPSGKPFGVAFPSVQSVPGFPFPGGSESAYTAASAPTGCAPGACSYPTGGPYSFPIGGPSDIPTPSVAPSKTGKGGEQHPPTALPSVSSLV